jgi:hypothetical protein
MAETLKTLDSLRELGLLDASKDGIFTPHNWNGRQFVTDGKDVSPAVRTKRWREKKKADEAEALRLASEVGDVTSYVTSDVTPKSDSNVTVASPRVRYRDIGIDKTDTEKEGTRGVALVPPGWPADYFEQFWKKYPNKVDRQGSAQALARVGSNGVNWMTVMHGLDAYIAKNDDRPWCNPTTWINQARWEDLARDTTV